MCQIKAVNCLTENTVSNVSFFMFIVQTTTILGLVFFFLKDG